MHIPIILDMIAMYKLIYGSKMYQLKVKSLEDCQIQGFAMLRAQDPKQQDQQIEFQICFISFVFYSFSAITFDLVICQTMICLQIGQIAKF